MATRGRKRQHDPSIPGHIDQGGLPRGVYWDRTGNGRWFVFERDVDGRAKRKTIAGREAKLSDLHRIVEERAGVDRTSLNWLLEQFHASPQYRDLAERTRADYDNQQKIVKKLQLANGKCLGDLAVARLTRAGMQRLVDSIGAETPTKANHLKRYLARVFRWGMNRGLCTDNPAKGIEQATERKQRRLPSDTAYARVLAHAQARGGYVWLAMELTYLCRLRSAEAFRLTDAHALEDGVLAERLKGSRDNVVAWTPRLRAVWKAATERRSKIMKRFDRETQIKPEDRILLVSEDGGALEPSSWSTAWNRMIRSALLANVITPAERFSFHDLKRKGITDTPGTRADKQHASGHKTAAMLDVYDQSRPVVRPSKE